MSEEGRYGGGSFPLRIQGRLTLAGFEPQWSPDAALAEAARGQWNVAVGRNSVLLGWSAADLAVIPALELLHPDDRDLVLDATQEVAGGPIPFRPLEIRVLGRDSRYWWTQWHLGVQSDGSPVLVGLDHLRPDDEFGPPVGMWHWDADSDVVSWSPELFDMFGMQVGPPASYASFLAVVLDDDRDAFASLVDRAVLDDQPFAATFRCPSPGDHDLWFHATGRLCASDDGSRRLTGLLKYLNPPPTWPRRSPIGCG
jgi:hypothetical protein